MAKGQRATEKDCAERCLCRVQLLAVHLRGEEIAHGERAVAIGGHAAAKLIASNRCAKAAVITEIHLASDHFVANATE